MLASCSEKDSKWEKFNVTEGNYSILMPSDAKKYVKQEETIFGKQAVHYLSWKPSTFSLNKIKLFQVTYTSCPRSAMADTVLLNATLDNSIENRKKNDFSEIEVATQRVDINGYPGRAFIYGAPKDNVITIVKECVAGDKLYDITVIAKRNYPTNAELTVFYNSFQILR